jgi:hypothetical protein
MSLLPEERKFCHFLLWCLGVVVIATIVKVWL